MMKNTFKKKYSGIVAMLGMLLTLAACDKDNTGNSTDIERDIFYTVTEEAGFSGFSGTTAHLTSEAEWDALLDQFCNFAQGGDQVTFCGLSSTQSSAAKSHQKDTPTSISTSDRDELKVWMKEMERLGKTVNVSFDSGTGTWNGRAYVNIGSPDASAEVATYSGLITFVPTPVFEEPPLDGLTMALQLENGDTYLITAYGMFLWFDTSTPDSFMRLLQGAPATLNGVAGSHLDLNGNTFLFIDLEETENGVIEF